MINPEPSIFCVMPEDIGLPDMEPLQHPGWYFADETQRLEGNGPFATIEECRESLQYYVEYIL